MVNKFVIVLKKIGRAWFILLVLAIIIVAFYNYIAAIVLTSITLVLFLLSYIPSLFFKSKVLHYIKKFYRIKDSDVIKKFPKNQEKVKNILFELAQDQEKKDWLIVFVDNHYIFYHKDAVEKYKNFYHKGLGEKKLFEVLTKIDIETRAEIKAIETTLKAQNRLDDPLTSSHA
ncbi:MAG: hypothetical protein BAJALOKI1v1_850016 [Promethearchaeota archaeon]|nr:MAG: hypothetical protein BAJALOKI1v1_850016 [Candidatus Lokiarchaeota archaeon]